MCVVLQSQEPRLLIIYIPILESLIGHTNMVLVSIPVIRNLTLLLVYSTYLRQIGQRWC